MKVTTVVDKEYVTRFYRLSWQSASEGLLFKENSTYTDPLCMQRSTNKGGNKRHSSELDDEHEGCCLFSSRVCLVLLGDT